MQDKMAGVHFLPLPQSYLEMRDEHALQISPPPSFTLHKKRKTSDKRNTHDSVNYKWSFVKLLPCTRRFSEIKSRR